MGILSVPKDLPPARSQHEALRPLSLAWVPGLRPGTLPGTVGQGLMNQMVVIAGLGERLHGQPMAKFLRQAPALVSSGLQQGGVLIRTADDSHRPEVLGGRPQQGNAPNVDLLDEARKPDVRPTDGRLEWI